MADGTIFVHKFQLFVFWFLFRSVEVKTFIAALCHGIWVILTTHKVTFKLKGT